MADELTVSREGNTLVIASPSQLHTEARAGKDPRRGVDARQDDGDDIERDEGAVASGARLMART